MPQDGGNYQCLDCPDCLKPIHVGTGGHKNLQHHQNGLECCKKQQCLKQGQKMAAQQMLLSAFIVTRQHPSQTHLTPTYAIKALWPLRPAPPLMSETTHVPHVTPP